MIEKKSTHKVEIVPILLEKHPNADALSLVKIYGGGYTVVVNTDDWKDKTLGAYLCPDSFVDTKRPEFSFLGDHPRITVRKFRGIYSQGLLVPAPEGSKIGDDVSDLLGVTRYEPEVQITSRGEATKPPEGFRPNYDVDAWNKYKYLLTFGEFVVITEKIHGCSAKYTYVDGKMYCGSKGEWKREEENNLWWKCLNQNPWIKDFCIENPGLTLYGEIYGPVQSLKYGRNGNNIGFAGFDIFDVIKSRFLSWVEIWEVLGKDFRNVSLDRWVPILYNGPYSEKKVLEFVDGPSTVSGADNIREGCVVQTIEDRYSNELGGRVKLKIVSNIYLSQNK
ncbi:MAG: RNA ligase family protein [Nanoarchaeota archaeon]